MNTLVIFHASCRDGFCAAWLFRLAFPEAEFHAAQHGTEPPDVCGKRVYIVDFSYKRDAMKQIMMDADSLVVLDHHRTAEVELADIVGDFEAEIAQLPVALPRWSARPVITFDMTKSGGRLAWEYLCRVNLMPPRMTEHIHPPHFGEFPPWLVKYTEDRDLWLWKCPDSREINATLASRPHEFAEWDYLHEHGNRRVGWEELITEGRAILRYQKQVMDSHVSHAREIDLDGHRVLAVNATTLVSEIAGALARDRPFGLCWFQTEDGKFVYSLRSREGGIDVSEIARRHGGGGHRAAAGFTAEAPPTLLIEEK
jgi:hypothetical protein